MKQEPEQLLKGMETERNLKKKNPKQTKRDLPMIRTPRKKQTNLQTQRKPPVTMGRVDHPPTDDHVRLPRQGQGRALHLLCRA